MMHNDVNTRLSVHLELKRKKGSNQNTHTAFNDFAGQTIYASIMQPVYIFQIPPVQITKTHFNPFTAGHKQLETRPEKIPPNKVMCLPSV